MPAPDKDSARVQETPSSRRTNGTAVVDTGGERLASLERQMKRREFLRQSAGVAAASIGLAAMGRALGADAPGPAEGRPKKGVMLGMLPGGLAPVERLKLAKECGWEGIEAPPMGLDQAKSWREAAKEAGIPFHSVIFGGWGAPLSSPDDAVAERGQRELEAGLRCAKELGADALLLVPVVVNAKTTQQEGYERSQQRLRKVIPVAEELGVIIAVEEVWNGFLLDADGKAFARYIDDFKSPFVQAYFDVGNIVKYGEPQDWIRTLGKRIRKVHLKDFKRPGQWTPLREGDVKWPEVRKALAEVGFTNYMTVELSGGDANYLRDLAGRVDKIIAEE